MTDEQGGLTRKQMLIWAVIGMVIFPTILVGAETFTGGFNTVESPGRFNAGQGPEVILGQDLQLEGGQPATASSINLSTENNGWLNVSATGDGPTVQVDSLNGTWTNVSGISGAGTHNITLQPSDKNFTRVGESITSFKFRDAKVNDTQADAIYSGSGTLVFETNASDGVQYGLVDVETEEAVGAGVADADGTVAFTDVQSGTSRTVRLEELGTMTAREELPNHSTLDNCSASATFFETVDDSPTILDKSAADGNFSFTGLPVDEQFAVQVECANHYNRTVLLPDLSQQKTVYLLNKSANTVNVTFDIQDNTGDFSGTGTDFVVQRAINRSIFNGGGFVWENVAGDELGASTSSRHVLEKGTRYRLKITNEAGETRILGAHVAEADGTVVIRINQVNLQANENTGYNVNFTRINESGTEFMQFVYIDADNSTSQVDLTIHEFGNESNVLHNQLHTGEYGTLVVTEQLTGADVNTTWVADWTATRDGSDVSGSLVAGQSQIPLDIALDDAWKHRIALISLIIIGFVVGSGLNPQIGAVAVVCTGGLWFFIGWMPPEVTAAAVTLASLIAVAFMLGTKEEARPPR